MGCVKMNGEISQNRHSFRWVSQGDKCQCGPKDAPGTSEVKEKQHAPIWVPILVCEMKAMVVLIFLSSL